MFSDTLELNKLTLVYCEMGKEALLAELFSYMGVLGDDGRPLTPAELKTHATALEDLWGVREKGRGCYCCNKPQPGDRLCSCYWQAVVHTENLPEVVAKMHDKATYASYICADCRKLQRIQVKRVKDVLTKHAVYRFPQFCVPCAQKAYKQREANQSRSAAPIRGAIRGTGELQKLQQQVAQSAPAQDEQA